MALRDAGAIVRAFADPMQRIFVSEVEFPWAQLVDANLTDELTDPHRWAHDLELGRWILDARARLAAANGFIDLRTAPPSVRVTVVPGPDIGNYGSGAPNGYFGPIRAMRGGGTGALLNGESAAHANLENRING